ncbi:DUF262 domain-containing protein [Staphylococcus delphini]|uniref:DUF262 domain-containing protein n=1 Tax=Staphylococcus delphini TaxID=53344 RepID=UPI0023B275B9|nr:DUF262 domain-containing protein [Staphylococcus delphini]MDE9805477.1 DUF262 domain-containing protein [Staphylococcus delphini]
MGFSTENRTVLSIFQRSSVYKVPRYQRSYVWNEKNWSELLADINFTVNIEDTNWSHFLGTIVLNNIDRQLGNRKDPGILNFEIIDGQQRITTLFIIFNAISRHLMELKTEEATNRANYIHSTYISAMKSNSEKIPKIENEDVEKDILEIIDYSMHLDSEKISSRNTFNKVYKYYLNFLSEKTFEETDIFLNKVLGINIVEIISEQEEEIYNIFEVLNARGQKLKQMELLKNHIMKYIHPRKESYIDHAKKKWNDITNRAETLSDIDNLMVHFAKCYIKKNAENSNSVYKLIKEEIKIEALSKMLSDFDEFSKIYIKVNEKDTDDTTIEYFNIKRNQQIRALLTAILVKEREGIITKDIREKAFLTLRNFFFIFNGMQKTSNFTDKLLNQYNYAIYHCQKDVEFKMLISELFFKLSRFINKEDFSSIMKNHPSFRYSNQDKTLKKNAKLVRFTLGEYIKIYQKDINITVKDLTIEHLLSDNGEKDTVNMGNLTLVSSHINERKLKNKEITEKLNIIKKESDININKSLDSYFVKDIGFDTLLRLDKIISDLYDKVFYFNPNIFNLNNEDVRIYFDLNEKFKEDEELLELLKENGKYFTNKISNDPSLKEVYERYLSLN